MRKGHMVNYCSNICMKIIIFILVHLLSFQMNLNEWWMWAAPANGATGISELFLVDVPIDEEPQVNAFIMLELVKKLELSKWVYCFLKLLTVWRESRRIDAPWQKKLLRKRRKKPHALQILGLTLQDFSVWNPVSRASGKFDSYWKLWVN